MGIEPSWEDPLNSIGGNFMFELKYLDSKQIDGIWKRLLLILMGGSWKYAKFVNGIRFVDRLHFDQKLKIEIWTVIGRKNSDFTDEEKNDLKEGFRNSLSSLLQSFCTLEPDEVCFSDHSKRM